MNDTLPSQGSPDAGAVSLLPDHFREAICVLTTVFLPLEMAFMAGVLKGLPPALALPLAAIWVGVGFALWVFYVTVDEMRTSHRKQWFFWTVSAVFNYLIAIFATITVAITDTIALLNSQPLLLIIPVAHFGLKALLSAVLSMRQALIMDEERGGPAPPWK